MITIENYIGGQFLPPQAGKYLDNINPATGAIFSLIPDSDAQDVEMAVQAARQAFPLWSAMSAEERSVVLLRLAQLIEDNLDSLALDESTDNGKPLQLAKTVDIPRAVQNFRFFATAILHSHTEAHPMGNKGINYTLKAPIGVVGCISPWNLPLYLFTWKIAPALASGNCVIAKPSEVTPLTAYRLSQLAQQAGLPAGVLNLVHGLGASAGNAIVSHPYIKAISFTGGTATGAHISSVAAPMFKKLSLELGGKNPALIFADCDYDKMLETVVRSSFSNQGQICLCSSRLLIERPLYERFKNDFVARVDALRIGDPLETETRIGAVVSSAHQKKVLSYVDLAIQEGGTRLTQREPLFTVHGRCQEGFFVAPTVIEGLTQDCRTNQEEIFGPVVTLQPFDTESEAIAMANGVRYGLAATLWTNSLPRANRISQALHTGIVWVNCWLLRDLRTPFGGMKDSGVGREGGFEALDFFTETKNVCIQY